jgi:nicotinamidase-related amidase
VSRPALIVVDVQNDFCDPRGALAQAGKPVESLMSVVPNVDVLVGAAREAGALIVFTQQTNHDRASAPPDWVALLERVVGFYEFTVQGTWGWDLAVEANDGEREIALKKTRSDAFLRTPLESILRDHGIDSLYVCGVVTEGCVLCTALSASCRDFDVALVGDAVASTDATVHDAALAIARRRMRVVDVSTAVEELSRVPSEVDR